MMKIASIAVPVAAALVVLAGGADTSATLRGSQRACVGALTRAGARVTLVYRRAEWRPTVKFWLRPDIDNRIAAGEVAARFETEIVAIERRHVVVRAKDGTEVYRERVAITRARVYASVVLAGGRLYVTTRDAGVAVLKTGDKYEELAVNKLEGDDSLFNASPAVSDSHLFLRTNRFLYCIGEQQ